MAHTSWIDRPTEIVRTPIEVETYLRASAQHRAHAMLLDEFERSGLKQAEIAKRSGKSPEVVSRMISYPGNWTINSLSDVLFAISGSAVNYKAEQLLEMADPVQSTSTDGEIAGETSVPETNANAIVLILKSPGVHFGG